MKFVDCYIHWSLYNDLLQWLSQTGKTDISITNDLTWPRIQALVYAMMHDELGRRQMAEPEGSWAASIANDYVSEFYRLLIGCDQ